MFLIISCRPDYNTKYINELLNPFQGITLSPYLFLVIMEVRTEVEEGNNFTLNIKFLTLYCDFQLMFIILLFTV